MYFLILVTNNKKVVAFNIAQYSGTVNRTKKPFNPILGETFEYCTKGYKFFTEQVCHHPPISALHCSSEFYEMFMDTSMKFSFWGKTLEGKPLGSMHIILKKYNEHYVIKRPISAACNIIIGSMYIDNYGELSATNYKTGEKALVQFKPKGWFGKNYGEVNGRIYNRMGDAALEIKGKWTDFLLIKNLATGEENPLWQRNERPAEWENYYYFTEFTYQLNYLTEKLKKSLPPTDSRFRPDLRALENGDMKLAQTEKGRLEEIQRAARKEAEKKGVPQKPNYFTFEADEATQEKYYKFNYKYWEDRDKQNWAHLPHIYS